VIKYVNSYCEGKGETGTPEEPEKKKTVRLHTLTMTLEAPERRGRGRRIEDSIRQFRDVDLTGKSDNFFQIRFGKSSK